MSETHRPAASLARGGASRLSDTERERTLRERYPDVFVRSAWRRWRWPLAGAALLAYLALVNAFLGVTRTLGEADWSLAGAYLADWVSWESRPDVAFDEDGALEVDFPRFDPVGDALEPDTLPDWLVPSTSRSGDGASLRIAMGDGAGATVRADRVSVTRGGRTVEVVIVRDESVTLPEEAPAWLSQRREGGKVIARFGIDGRLEIEDDEVKVRKRFIGWENFLFDARSPLHGLSGDDLVATLLSPERLDPERSNLSLAWNEFLYNAEWQHLDVWTKLLQTIVMAFVGTLFAALLAFSLGFFAARTMVRNTLVNQLVKRAFDFLRSVDMLIWALFFTRAFGPGPLAGIAAIFLTDTGTLGKLNAEALENVDERQRDGLRAVGAASVPVQRYGVLPQVLPLFLGQALYFWESNTRSATIIGAVGAGGIGLKLWEAMRTNQDWENVLYMVVLILVVVYLFDSVSSALRGRLIERS